MDPAAPRPIDPDAKSTKLSPPLPNGTVKKRPAPSLQDSLYRECMKNHAASLGGHALDGCGEFMPSPSSNPADPTSLKCAACGCHRNFHRRLPDPHPPLSANSDDDDDDHVDEENNDKNDDDNDKERQQQQQQRQQSSSSPPPHYFSSAPHMLLALSTGVGGGGSPAPALAAVQRKRFRTKFSAEQKGKMQELSERLGWRMQKRDEGVVEECCKGIGVGKGVFKVWMHNNKHNFVPGSSRRGDQIGGGDGSGFVGASGSGFVGASDGGGFDGSSSGGGGGGGGGGGDVGRGGDNGHAVNGSSSSS